MTSFIIVAGRKGVVGTAVLHIKARNAGEAHPFAADQYRREYGLASNIHVKTQTVYESQDEEEALIFMARLFAKMDEEQNATTGSSPEEPQQNDQGEHP